MIISNFNGLSAANYVPPDFNKWLTNVGLASLVTAGGPLLSVSACMSCHTPFGKRRPIGVVLSSSNNEKNNIYNHNHNDNIHNHKNYNHNHNHNNDNYKNYKNDNNNTRFHISVLRFGPCIIPLVQLLSSPHSCVLQGKPGKDAYCIQHASFPGGLSLAGKQGKVRSSGTLDYVVYAAADLSLAHFLVHPLVHSGAFSGTFSGTFSGAYHWTFLSSHLRLQEVTSLVQLHLISLGMAYRGSHSVCQESGKHVSLCQVFGRARGGERESEENTEWRETCMLKHCLT
jgi:hypothetical protein